MPVSNAASTTLTASGTAVVTMDPMDDAGRVILSGTYSGLSLRIQASKDGTNYVDVAAFQENVGAFVQNPLTPGTANVSYLVRGIRGYAYFAAVCTFTSGSVIVGMQTANILGSPTAAVDAQTNSWLEAIALGMSNLTDTDLAAAVGSSFS